MGAGLPLPSGAVRTDRRTQAAGDARRPAGRRQEAQSPGTHHSSGFGGLGGGNWGAHGTQAGGSGSVQTDRPLPPSLSRCSPYRHTPPSPAQPQTPRHTDPHRADGRRTRDPWGPGGPTQANTPQLGTGGRGRLRAEGGGGCRCLEEPEREGLAHSLCSRTHTLTRDAINIQSPSAPAGRPTAPPLGLPGDPSSCPGWGRGPPPHSPTSPPCPQLPAPACLLGQENEGRK